MVFDSYLKAIKFFALFRSLRSWKKREIYLLLAVNIYHRPIGNAAYLYDNENQPINNNSFQTSFPHAR